MSDFRKLKFGQTPVFPKMGAATRAVRAKAAAAKRKKKVGLNKVEKKQVKHIIALRKEFKYCPNWYKYDNFATYGGLLQPALNAPKVLPSIFDATDRPTGFYLLQTGNYLNSISTGVNAVIASSAYPVGGYGMERGDNSNTIDGDYAYMQSTQISITICADTLDSNNGDVYNPAIVPLDFRVIRFRAKKDASGTSPNLLKALFLDNENVIQGLNSVGSVKEVTTDWRVNSDQLIVDQEIRFKLNNPNKPSVNVPMSAQSALIGQTMPRVSNAPAEKNLKLWLNRPKKRLRFNTSDDGSINYYEPLNYDYVTYIAVIATRAQDGGGDTDVNATAWSMRINGTTKYRDC